MSRTLYLTTLLKESSEDWNADIILSAWLDQLGVDLTIASAGVPSILDGPDSALVITAQAVNAADFTSKIDGTIHPPGSVLTYHVAGGTRGGRYDVKFPFTTTDGQTLSVIQPFLLI